MQILQIQMQKEALSKIHFLAHTLCFWISDIALKKNQVQKGDGQMDGWMDGWTKHTQKVSTTNWRSITQTLEPMGDIYHLNHHTNYF